MVASASATKEKNTPRIRKSMRSADEEVFQKRPWLWRPGQKPGRGRSAGTPNLTTVILKDALLMAGHGAGDHLKELVIASMRAQKASELEIENVLDNMNGGLVGYLEWLALEHPGVYGPILAKVLPMQIKVDRKETVTYKTVEEIELDIKARRIPLRRLLNLAANREQPVEAATPPTEPTTVESADGASTPPAE